MNQDWVRLGAAIREARRARGMSQLELAEAASVSEGTIQNLEGLKEAPTRRLPTLPRVEAALGWIVGAHTHILRGEDPPLVPSGPESAAGAEPGTDGPMRDLPLRIRHELSESEVLDSEVLDLTAAGTKMLVLFTRPDDSGASEEELRRDFKKWTEVQRRLRGIVAEQEDGPAAQ